MEALAHLGLILSGLAAVVQASGFECLVLDPFSFQQDGLSASEVNVSGRQVGDALVVSQVVVVGDKVTDLVLEIARQVVFLEQDAVPERWVPALNFALGLRMLG